MTLNHDHSGQRLPSNPSRLALLRLPSLQGRRFLDVRSGDGFFCGFAQFEGAVESVGLEPDAKLISQARSTFPRCEFRQQSWDNLPNGPFDVIFVAYALHLVPDPATFVRALTDLLTPEGTLVIELGMARSRKVVDTYPNLARLPELFRGTAWKQMGPSARKASETVRWQVFHVRRRKPFAYLLMQPPAYGKSTLARELFGPARVHVVSGDQTIQAIAVGKLEAPTHLQAVIAEDFSTTTIDRTIHRVFEHGLGEQLIRYLIGRGGSADFALDAFLPAVAHDTVERIAREAGFVPIHLQWDSPYAKVSSMPSMPERADTFAKTLARVE